MTGASRYLIALVTGFATHEGIPASRELPSLVALGANAVTRAIAPVSTLEKMSTVFTLAYAATGGVQEPKASRAAQKTRSASCSPKARTNAPDSP